MIKETKGNTKLEVTVKKNCNLRYRNGRCKNAILRLSFEYPMLQMETLLESLNEILSSYEGENTKRNKRILQ